MPVNKSCYICLMGDTNELRAYLMTPWVLSALKPVNVIDFSGKFFKLDILGPIPTIPSIRGSVCTRSFVERAATGWPPMRLTGRSVSTRTSTAATPWRRSTSPPVTWPQASSRSPPPSCTRGTRPPSSASKVFF